ncbi:hypothetical protein [Pandoraea sp.]|uniref:hypothetical protein n=1 Tax=Pandoraea sp. TaxID=1883445 RepID=UPI0035B0BA2E
MTDGLRLACEDYCHYVKFILEPAKLDFEQDLEGGAVSLHRAFGANLLLAHSVDYLLAIRKEARMGAQRKDLVKSFDANFAVAGAYLGNRKMELIDAVNNALKHIRIDPKRYKDLRYGEVSFKSLVEVDGRVMCHLEKYRFDYCRVVLRPTFRALCGWEFREVEDVFLFARGDIRVGDDGYYSDIYDPDDPSTAIDRMIEICSSPCKNCDEAADDCQCAEWVFDDEKGRFEPLVSVSEGEFNSIMDQISPSYSRS